jgi:hypothetical protein
LLSTDHSPFGYISPNKLIILLHAHILIKRAFLFLLPNKPFVGVPLVGNSIETFLVYIGEMPELLKGFCLIPRRT